MKKLQIEGKKFGKITALKPTNKRRGGKIVWLCKSDCGKIHESIGTDLSNGRTKSCGCSKSDFCRLARTKHGKSGTRIFNIWQKMRFRCSEKAKGINKLNYYDKGIRVCERWQGENGFVNFMKDVGERPSDLYSLDRIDNKKGYEPNNVRWATAKEQINNRSLKRIENFSDKEIFEEVKRRGIYKTTKQKELL